MAFLPARMPTVRYCPPVQLSGAPGRHDCHGAGEVPRGSRGRRGPGSAGHRGRPARAGRHRRSGAGRRGRHRVDGGDPRELFRHPCRAGRPANVPAEEAVSARRRGLLGGLAVRGDDAVISACLRGEEESAIAAAERLLASGRGGALYRSSKIALNLWVRQSAAGEDWAGTGVVLNVIAPGIVETDTARGTLYCAPTGPIRMGSATARSPHRRRSSGCSGPG